MTAPTLSSLESYRQEFPILQCKTYLNTCSLGALSQRSIEKVNRFLELWAELGAAAWYELWLGEIAALRKRFARVIGASPHEIAITPCISTGLSTIASCLDYSRRNVVVVNDMDFPTIAHQWLAKARQGVEVRFVESEDRIAVPVEKYA